MKIKTMTGLQIAFFSILIAATAQSVFADEGSGNPANKAKFQAQLQQCATSAQVTLPTSPEGWKSLSRENKRTIHACMSDAGFKMNRHHHHWKAIQACLGGLTPPVTLPKHVSGQGRPTLTADQLSAVNTCKEQLHEAHAAKNSNPVSN